MEKIRCPSCGQTLLYADLIDAEIKCSRCKKIVSLKKERATEHCKTSIVRQ